MDPRNRHHKVFLEWNAAIAKGEWDAAECSMAEVVAVNGTAIARHVYIQKLQDEGFENAALDICIADDGIAEIAARYVFPRALEPTGQGEEWTEQTLYSIVNDKISAIQALGGANKAEKLTTKDYSTTDRTQSNKLQTADLRKFYAEYIDSINTLTMHQRFGASCHDVVRHNYHDYGRDEYRKMIESSIEEISGLHFNIERLIVDQEAQQVAARLGFSGVPTKDFRGIPPTGNAVKFSEHAFYQLEHGRIKQVWSLLDLAAYRESIERGGK